MKGDRAYALGNNLVLTPNVLVGPELVNSEILLHVHELMTCAR
jgi:hypothetical protein